MRLLPAPVSRHQVRFAAAERISWRCCTAAAYASRGAVEVAVDQSVAPPFCDCSVDAAAVANHRDAAGWSVSAQFYSESCPGLLRGTGWSRPARRRVGLKVQLAAGQARLIEGPTGPLSVLMACTVRNGP